MYRVLIPALLAASTVSALSISSGCETALQQVAANSDAEACLGISSLISVVISPNSSIVTPVDTMLKTLCAAAPCSNATLSAVITNVTAGCSAELASADTSASELTSLVEQYYPTVRQILCLSDSGTNCITQTLTNIQSLLGTLSLSNIATVIENAFTTTSIPSNITCTACVQEVYNIVSANIPSAASTLASGLGSECGSSFTDGSTPTGVAEIAASTSAGSNSAKGFVISRGTLAGVGAAGLIFISSLWTLLA